MPQYDFRCKACGKVFSVTYRTYGEYDSAAPRCCECGSADLARLISRVSIGGLRRDYSKMSSGEMLSVLEAGDRSQVSELFRQVGGEDRVRGGAAQKPPAKPADPSQGEKP